MNGDRDSSNIQPRQSLSDKQFWAGGINILSSDLEPLEAFLETEYWWYEGDPLCRRAR